mgnify:CR=1 FL=1
MIKVADIFTKQVSQLGGTDSNNPDGEVRTIICHVLRIEEEPNRFFDLSLDDKQLDQIENCVLRRTKGEPLALILGYTDFLGLRLRVKRGVSVPVREMEEMIAHTMDELLKRCTVDQEVRILDLGTGTGCLLLGLLKSLPNASGVGVDSDDKSLEIAKQNAESCGLADRSHFQKGDWLLGIEERFDLIVCNPPAAPSNMMDSLPTALRNFEPRRAVDGGYDGLCAFRAIVDAYEDVIKPTSIGVFHVHNLDREADFFRQKGLGVEVKLNSRVEPCCIVVAPKQSYVFIRLLKKGLRRLVALFE